MENWPEFIKNHFATVPYFEFMDVTVLETSKGQAKLKLPLKPQYSNTYGITHGGIVTALVDMAAGVALRTLKLRILTVEISTNYFEPVALDDELIAEARLVQQGRKLLYADVNVFNRENVLVAGGKAIYYVRGEDRAELYATQRSEQHEE